jgi:hypothetical protein
MNENDTNIDAIFVRRLLVAASLLNPSARHNPLLWRYRDNFIRWSIHSYKIITCIIP